MASGCIPESGEGGQDPDGRSRKILNQIHSRYTTKAGKRDA